MVHRQEHHSLVVRRAEKHAAQQRTFGQVERPSGFLSHQPLKVLFAAIGGDVSQIDPRDRYPNF